MRIISFTEMWPKLQQGEFTTFRFPRRDKNYQIGEKLQCWYRQRSPKRKYLFNAEIIRIENRQIVNHNGELQLNDVEAKEDGFPHAAAMYKFLLEAHGPARLFSPINKLTLQKLTMLSGLGRQ